MLTGLPREFGHLIPSQIMTRAERLLLFVLPLQRVAELALFLNNDHW
jgi:hypothetical protein